MDSPTTADSGGQSPKPGSSGRPSPPTGRQAASASSDRRRVPPGPKLFEFDRLLGFDWVAGADEAGRGCLAGPLVAAAVAFEQSRVSDRLVESLRWLNDSKRVSENRRDALFAAIVGSGARFSLSVRPASVIDRDGLHVSNIGALTSAFASLDLSNHARGGTAVFLSDGFEVPVGEDRSRKLVKGDSTSAAIAAASILAKVSRDRMMRSAALRWPEYGFDSHVGYASEVHRAAIARHGPTPIHRMSFNSDAYNAPSST